MSQNRDSLGQRGACFAFLPLRAVQVGGGQSGSSVGSFSTQVRQPWIPVLPGSAFLESLLLQVTISGRIAHRLVSSVLYFQF